MKHASIVIAVLVGAAIGFFTRGAIDGPSRAAPRPAAPAQRAQRPTEDPKAVYRVPLEDSPAKGPADALVTIVESSDFECPFCKRVVPTLKQIEEAYAGKVRFVFKHNPLPFHARALPAALAAEEARAQGGDAKFWAMHDALFAAPSLDDAALEKAAQDVGVDVAKVREAVKGGKYKDRIERDQRLVQSVGAPATPSFFVNGRKLAGAQPFEAFRALIDEELAKAQALVASGTPAAQVYARISERGATAPVYLPGSAPAPQQPGAQPGAQPAAAPPAPPPPVYRDVKLRTDDPVRGPSDAKLTVVLFSDFQCPFCSRVEPSLKQLEEAFPGQVRIVWKHQPLPMHPNARPAALAAEAAREQGKFWPMHDKLFSDQQALGDATYARYAKELGLDVRRFQASLAAKKAEARIAEDQAQAQQVGANGTPTMFFNCRQVVGARPFDQLRATAEEELKKAEALSGGKRDPAIYEKACKANLAAAPAAQLPAAAAPAGPAAPLAPGALPIRADDPARGNPKAPVTIVLFSDFQCPFCARVEPTLARVEQEYGSKVRVVWKHQPLPFHPNALPAAEAAEAAREQGKFWPMHDRLFAAQQQLSPDLYQRVAGELGLDLRRFQEATRSGRGKARILEDQRVASQIGAQATPTMFVNGEKVEGAVPFEMLKAVIDRKLANR